MEGPPSRERELPLRISFVGEVSPWYSHPISTVGTTAVSPKKPRTKAAGLYRKRLPIKMMVQKRQFRKSHIDEHYCAAIFHYLREYALKLRDDCLFICLDDKHRLKVGEPGFPVAAAERGRRVIVSLNEEFQVGDHDFTRFSIIPIVIFHIDIPDSIEGSWSSVCNSEGGCFSTVIGS